MHSMGARAWKLASGWRYAWIIAAWTTAGTLTALWLFGAELTPVAPPAIEPAWVLAPEPVTPVSGEFRRRMEGAAAALPDGVRRALAEAGWRVQLAEFVVDAAPSLTGERPRGWPTGLTWENTDAVNLPQRRLVIVAEKRRNRQGEVVSADRMEGVFRHELGHAYDSAAGGRLACQSSHPEFMAAYESDLQGIAPDRRGELEYYLQGRAAGRQEAYAEAFAVLLGGGSDPAKREAFIAAFPRVMQFLERSLSDQQVHVERNSFRSASLTADWNR
jgi:hypothetical protein